MPKIKIMVDGNEIPINCLNDVKVIVEDAEYDGDLYDLHFTFTDEGEIVDAVVDDEIAGSITVGYNDTIEDCGL